MKDRFGSPYDAVLHLLDRQVLDRDGLMVCKVDDLELSEDGDGLRATGLLAGSAALLGRLSPWLRDYWERLGDEQADRRVPYRIGLEAVDEVTSAVSLNVTRHDALVRATPPRRLSALLRMTVETSAGPDHHHILDVRLDDSQRVVGLVVGRGRPGSLLGYDRNGDQGPALVRHVVRRLHRHSAYVPWERVTGVDWDAGRVRAEGPLEALASA